MREISVGEIESMRREVDPLFQDTCQIFRLPQTPDDAGGFEADWEQIGGRGALIRCRIDPSLWRRPMIFQFGETPVNIDSLIVTFEYDQDVKNGDMITFPNHPGEFIVQGIINDPTISITKQAAIVKSP